MSYLSSKSQIVYSELTVGGSVIFQSLKRDKEKQLTIMPDANDAKSK